MNYQIRSFIAFLFISLVLVNASTISEEEKEKLKPQVSHVEACKEGYPYLSVGDFNLTSENYTNVTKASKALLVVVTSSDCQHCCKFEEFFQEVKDTILTNKTLLHGLNIKLARATLEDNPKLRERIKKLPEFVFYHKDDTYSFEHSYDSNTIGRIMSKIIQPIKTLNEYSEFQEFLQKEFTFEKGDEIIKSLKVIGLYYKDDDLGDELKEFKKTAKHYAIYRDLQFALITKASIIENIHREKGSLWFPPYIKSTVLVVDRKNRVHRVDPTLSKDQLSDQIHLKGKGLVDPLTMETQELFRRMRWPLLISFLNPDDTKNFKNYLDILTEVAQQLEGRMAFSYLNNTRHENKREVMGIYHSKVPALSISLPNSPLLFPYPEEKELNVPTLKKFITDFFENKIAPFDPSKVQGKVQDPNNPTLQLFSDAEKLNIQNFKEFAFKEGTDAMILILNSDSNENLESLAKNYNRAAERFKALNINSVKLGVYDLKSNPSPPSVEIYTTPMIIFLPAYQKSPPFKYYTDNPKALALMLYIEKYADVTFKLPDLPHLPPEMHDAYYTQKKQLEEARKTSIEGEIKNQKQGENKGEDHPHPRKTIDLDL